MENIILFDPPHRESLLPLTYTRPVAEIRIGILTNKEKWEKHLSGTASYFTENYLVEKYPLHIDDSNIVINASLLPDEQIVEEIQSLPQGVALMSNNELLAVKASREEIQNFENLSPNQLKVYDGEVRMVKNLWQIFSLNGQEIASDFVLITKGRQTAQLSSTVQVINPENVFVEDGFKGEFFTVNASEGPVYFGANSEVMEGTNIRGAFALCDHSTLKLGTKIYGPTTIGPYCKVGGEVNNVVFFGFANKAHDGFLGNSVIGEWCNIGADSNNSNLKNNYTEVRLWNYPDGRFIKTGLQFCGLIMGDHSKCGINTMFNTGTVVGVSANIFGSGFPRNFIPSYSWGGASGFEEFGLKKALGVVKAVYSRRGMELTEVDANILAEIFNQSLPYRKF